MHHLLKTAFVIAGLGLLAGGCSGKSTDGGGSAGPVAAADFPAQLADAYCDAIAPCCDAAHLTQDSATCKSNLTQVGESAVQTQPGQNYDPVAAGGCLAQFKSVLKSCQPYEDSGLISECDKIVVGTAPTGAACIGNVECAAPNVCLFNPGLDTGRCGAAPARAALGAACTSGNCVVGAWCKSGVCVASTDSGPCADFDACSAKSYCASGQCSPRKADGQACIDDLECVNGKCLVAGGGTCGSVVLATAASCQGEFK